MFTKRGLFAYQSVRRERDGFWRPVGCDRYLPAGTEYQAFGSYTTPAGAVTVIKLTNEYDRYSELTVRASDL